MKRILFYFFALSIIICLPVLAQDTERTKMYYDLGQMYYEIGLYKEAEEEFKKALESSGKTEVIQEVKKDEKKAKSEIAYIIDEGDTLSIRVWENRDLNQTVIVRPDGKISFPLIDEVKAQGLTISELDRAMTEKLKTYIKFPDVSISLTKMGGSKIIILGEVKNPKTYTINGRKTILEAIAMAGGFTDDSIASSVVLVRGGMENPVARRLNLNQALHNPKTNQNIVLKSNDIVFVPKKFIADVNYVIRQIIEPFSSARRSLEDTLLQ